MSSMITAENVDLSNCDREQVQFSGAVQPHGCMLVLDEPSLAVLQASANTRGIVGVGPEELIGSGLESVLGAHSADIIAGLRDEELGNGPVHLACINAEANPGGRPVNLFAHRSGCHDLSGGSPSGRDFTWRQPMIKMVFLLKRKPGMSRESEAKSLKRGALGES